MSDVTVDRDLVTVREYTRFLEHDPEVKHPLGWSGQLAYPENTVTGMTHHEAAAYCAWMGAHLPTEAEWAAALTTIAWGSLWEWTVTPGVPGTFVLRGGSWANGPIYLRAANRNSNSPGLRSYGIGFRCARGV